MNKNYIPNSKEIKILQQTFGDDWRSGMKKNPHIDRVSEREVQQAKAKQEKRKNDRKREVMEEAIVDVHKRGKIDSAKANKLINILNAEK